MITYNDYVQLMSFPNYVLYWYGFSKDLLSLSLKLLLDWWTSINLLVETDANLVSWPLQRFDDTWEERWLPCQVHPDKMETGFTMFGLSLKYYIRSMYQVGPTALFAPISSSSWVMTHICYTCYSLQNTLPATSCCFHGGTHLWSIRSLNPLAPLNWHWSWFISDPEWVAIRFFQNKFAQYNFGALSLSSFL